VDDELVEIGVEDGEKNKGSKREETMISPTKVITG